MIEPAEGGAGRPSHPYALPHAQGETPPAALDAAGLQQIVAGFVDAARRSVRLGLQAIELPAVHGCLLHQFLSPIANQRTDEFGGSSEHRMRFPLAMFDAVRAAVPSSVVLGMRLSAKDWVEGGWDLPQSVRFAQVLKVRGADFIHVSSGGVSPHQQILVGPGQQVHLAENIRREGGLLTMATGLSTEPQQAEDMLVNGQADAVAIARGILYEPAGRGMPLPLWVRRFRRPSNTGAASHVA